MKQILKVILFVKIDNEYETLRTMLIKTGTKSDCDCKTNWRCDSDSSLAQSDCQNNKRFILHGVSRFKRTIVMNCEVSHRTTR